MSAVRVAAGTRSSSGRGVVPRRLAPGTDPARPWHETRVLAVDARRGTLRDVRVGELTRLLRAGDLVVLNDSATLPASLRGALRGEPVELRLTGAAGAESFPAVWEAVLFGAGDWRDDTDARPLPPDVEVGDLLTFGELTARVVHAPSARRLEVRFDRRGDALAEALYVVAGPVQYRHLAAPLSLADVQTPYAAAPWSVEMPSTGRPLAWPLLAALERCGVQRAFLTHAAGLSATGDPALDAALPFPERYLIPDATAEALRRARARGGRIIAAGTTVVRALEASGGAAGPGVARGRIGSETTLEVTSGILTGVHSPGESHFALLGAFAPATILAEAHAAAARWGYLAHELGDLMLIT